MKPRTGNSAVNDPGQTPDRVARFARQFSALFSARFSSFWLSLVIFWLIWLSLAHFSSICLFFGSS